MKKYTLILLFISLNAFTQKAFNENEYRKGKKTIVFFHPYMNNENYFKEFALPLIDKFNIVHLRGAKGNNNIYNWYDLDVYSDSFINVSQAKNVIEKTNALLKDFNNIVLVGYSQGGIIANGLMLLNPKKYNRVI
ncbi:alpha/beta hydrolase, partial [Tenacibaculum maritimum]|uniref:alpha/beta hydrolase n=1 Tax=Tenacibaculum maritimum TaxID=107401 RepID=UPI003875D36F